MQRGVACISPPQAVAREDARENAISKGSKIGPADIAWNVDGVGTIQHGRRTFGRRFREKGWQPHGSKVCLEPIDRGIVRQTTPGSHFNTVKPGRKRRDRSAIQLDTIKWRTHSERKVAAHAIYRGHDQPSPAARPNHAGRQHEAPDRRREVAIKPCGIQHALALQHGLLQPVIPRRNERGVKAPLSEVPKRG